MLPGWIEKILEGMGISGAIIFVLLATVAGLVAYVRSLQAKADKVYGYRLQERDTLNKALSDAASAIAGMLEATEDRNDLTEEQARLIEKQSQAFELLKVTILAQYDNIRDHNNASTQAVTSLAEAVRTLNTMLTENRQIANGYVVDLNKQLVVLSGELSKAIAAASHAQIVELRSLLGNVTIVQRRRKSP
jgi:hypothetical protein